MTKERLAEIRRDMELFRNYLTKKDYPPEPKALCAVMYELMDALEPLLDNHESQYQE